MVGSTLIDIREHIEALADEEGRYYVVCGRTGEQPIPVVGLRFANRETTQAAARAAEQYRTALRRYDPRTPFYDLIVCEQPATEQQTNAQRVRNSTSATPQRTLSDPVLDDSTPTPQRRDRIEFCHRVAGAVFETLSENGYHSVETAVMDAYFELAETIDNPDELCLCLLESTAAELGERLDPSKQADVISTAAVRLGTTQQKSDPVMAALRTLEKRGLIETAVCQPESVAVETGSRAPTVELSGYALAPQGGYLPVLPLTLELSRHTQGRLPGSVAVTATDDGWELRIALAVRKIVFPVFIRQLT